MFGVKRARVSYLLRSNRKHKTLFESELVSLGNTNNKAPCFLSLIPLARSCKSFNLNKI